MRSVAEQRLLSFGELNRQAEGNLFEALELRAAVLSNISCMRNDLQH